MITPSNTAQQDIAQQTVRGVAEAEAFADYFMAKPSDFSLPFGQLEALFSLAEAMGRCKARQAYPAGKEAGVFVTFEEVLQCGITLLDKSQLPDFFHNAAHYCHAFVQHGMVSDPQSMHTNMREIFLDEMTEPLPAERRARVRSMLGARLDGENPPHILWRGGGGGAGDGDIRERQEIFFRVPTADAWMAIARKAGLGKTALNTFRAKLALIAPGRAGAPDVQLALPLGPSPE